MLIELGIYDQIMNVVERERILGRLQGLNDLQAYKVVWDALDKAGKLGVKESSSPEPKVKKSITQEEINKKKKSATGTTGKVSNVNPRVVLNPFELNDEEFEKLTLKDFLK